MLRVANSEKAWKGLSEDALLSLRIKALGLDPKSSDIWPWVVDVFKELESRELTFRPRIYFGDEWFSPEGICAVAIPFFLAHPKLRRLERSQMLECEGEDEKTFKRLFRHELGHAFDHAFKVSKRRSWKKIFGPPTQEYDPETYRPRPYSKNFVRNLPRWYAQAHPDEDFAESFAVWLDPHSNWKSAYRSWGAIKKLHYIESLCSEFKNHSVPMAGGRMIYDAEHLTTTLQHYYEKKKKHSAEDLPDFYDRDLRLIFADRSSSQRTSEAAHHFLRRNEKQLLHTVSHWTGERRVTIEALMQKFKKRCKDLSLYVKSDAETTLIELSSFLTTLVSHYRFTGHFRRTV